VIHRHYAAHADQLLTEPDPPVVLEDRRDPPRRSEAGTGRGWPTPGSATSTHFSENDLAARCWARISAATVFTLTRYPASRRSAVIIGEPRLPSCRPNKRAISAASLSRRA
jgi:hypothetical protein